MTSRMPDWLVTLWSKEPTILTLIVTQVIALAVAFGVQVTPEQRTAILGATEIVALIVSAIVIRGTVSSPATVAATAADNVVKLHQAATFRAPPTVTPR